MKTENFNKEDGYVAPEMETIKIVPRAVLLDGSCPTYTNEDIDDPCPTEEKPW